MLTPANFLNSRHGSLDPRHPIWKKLWNSILSQLNIGWWNWKNNFNYIKGFKIKKITIKRSMIKIEITKIIFDWRVKLKIKINLAREPRKQKEWGSKLT